MKYLLLSRGNISTYIKRRFRTVFSPRRAGFGTKKNTVVLVWFFEHAYGLHVKKAQKGHVPPLKTTPCTGNRRRWRCWT